MAAVSLLQHGPCRPRLLKCDAPLCKIPKCSTEMLEVSCRYFAFEVTSSRPSWPTVQTASRSFPSMFGITGSCGIGDSRVPRRSTIMHGPSIVASPKGSRWARCERRFPGAPTRLLGICLANNVFACRAPGPLPQVWQSDYAYLQSGKRGTLEQ